MLDITQALFGTRAAQSRYLAEKAWASFVALDNSLPQDVWDVVWDDSVGHTLASFVAADIPIEACHALLRSCMLGRSVHEMRLPLSTEAGAIFEELRIWHASWQLAKATHVIFDFENNFGWHALPANDPAWKSEQFLEDWMGIARGGCRGEDQAERFNILSGPLVPSELASQVEVLLPPEYKLISIAGSGTEAVESFYDIANSYLTARIGMPVPDAKLLFFRGAYVGGAHGLQGANGTRDIARHAISPSRVEDGHMIDDGPYTRAALDDWEALLDGRYENSPESAALTKAEQDCLTRIEVQVERLEAAGYHVGGVVVEYVLARTLVGLRPSFVSGLRQLLHAKHCLLFEDAVMVGLRTGAPFLGSACSSAQPDFVAIGKAFGFSGVLENTQRNLRLRIGSENLNGYLTCRISCADVLRATTVLRSIHSRGLMLNAHERGRRLKMRLRQQGLVVWGLGLMLGYDNERGLMLNAKVLFSRCLPTLAFDESGGGDVDKVYAVGGADAKRVAARFVALKIEECGVVGEGVAEARKAAHASPFLNILMMQGAASDFVVGRRILCQFLMVARWLYPNKARYGHVGADLVNALGASCDNLVAKLYVGKT
ncbi:unnamed protein product [Prorocentrum cordatum]|uniref:Uncharacterized protein n=1 Tax=Prorocentrum cordatum TaxID=2364126 RepID=A0ABN9RXB0_9DINO|nr:unnamed protein product [Polarella glacialis]